MDWERTSAATGTCLACPWPALLLVQSSPGHRCHYSCCSTLLLLLLLVQLFTSDGIPIEPFHLRRERAEGFFDGEGNYVEYRLEPVSDAWLDSLGVSGLIFSF
jgi:hypothetical protein